MRSRVSPKLPIARAAMPMFSPSCGSTRITTGPANVTPDLVLSVPEPDISLHFLIQPLKSLNQAPRNLIQHLIDSPIRSPVRQYFSSNIIGLVMFSDVREEPQRAARGRPVARIPISDTVSTTTKANLQKRPESRLNGFGIWGGSDAPQMVVGDCRIDSHFGRRITRPSDANLRRHPDPGCAIQGRQGQHHERPALHPAECDDTDARSRRSRGS